MRNFKLDFGAKLAKKIVVMCAMLLCITGFLRADVLDDSIWNSKKNYFEGMFKAAQSTERKVDAIKSLEGAEHPELVPLLLNISARNASDSEIQMAIFEVLTSVKEKALIDAIYEHAFKSRGYAMMLLTAIGIIIKKGTEEIDYALEKLVEASKNRRAEYVLGAISGLRFSAKEEAVQPIVDVANQNTRNKDIFAAAMRCLGYIGKINKKAAVPVLIGFLNDRRIRRDQTQDVVNALITISGYDLGDDVTKWESWWHQAQKSESGIVELTGVTFKPAPTWFGVPINRRNIVFIIDLSQSMEDPVTPNMKEQALKIEKSAVTGNNSEKDDAQPKKRKPLNWDNIKTKLDLAREEFKRCLDELTDDYNIALVTYSTEVIPEYPYRLRPATASFKRELVGKIAKATPSGFTNIHGAILEGFKYATSGDTKSGNILTGEIFTSGVDAIFFLTDGFATWSNDSTELIEFGDGKKGNGKHVDRNEIIKSVRKLIEARDVIINCVGLGFHDWHLLIELSRNSGGTYVPLGN